MHRLPVCLCKIHLLFKYFPKPLCDFFTTLLVQMISLRQAVGILHCDRTVVVVDKGYAVFAAGFGFPVEVIDHRAVAEIIAVDIDGFAVCIREGAVGLGEQVNADMRALLLEKLDCCGLSAVNSCQVFIVCLVVNRAVVPVVLQVIEDHEVVHLGKVNAL